MSNIDILERLIPDQTERSGKRVKEKIGFMTDLPTRSALRMALFAFLVSIGITACNSPIGGGGASVPIVKREKWVLRDGAGNLGEFYCDVDPSTDDRNCAAVVKSGPVAEARDLGKTAYDAHALALAHEPRIKDIEIKNAAHEVFINTQAKPAVDWVNNEGKALPPRIDNLDKKVGGHATRLGKVEKRVKKVAEKTQRNVRAIKGISGRQDAIEELLAAGVPAEFLVESVKK